MGGSKRRRGLTVRVGVGLLAAMLIVGCTSTDPATRPQVIGADGSPSAPATTASPATPGTVTSLPSGDGGSGSTTSTAATTSVTTATTATVQPSTSVPATPGTATSAPYTRPTFIPTAPLVDPTVPSSVPPVSLEVPPGAFEKTEAGAGEFAAWFANAPEIAFAAGSTQLLEQQYTEDCKLCKGQFEDLTNFIDDHYTFIGEPRYSTSIYTESTMDTVIAIIYTHIPAYELKDGVDNIVEKQDTKAGHIYFELDWLHGQWMVTDMRVVRP